MLPSDFSCYVLVLYKKQDISWNSASAALTAIIREIRL